VESGHELRLVCRELARVVRDMLIVSVDPSRVNDAEIAEGERQRLVQVTGRFSREDLLRAFDVLAAAEQEMRTAAQPRYHLEMALLKWMHLRKLVPLTDLLAGSTGSLRAAQKAPTAPKAPVAPRAPGERAPLAPNAPVERVEPGTGQLKDALLAEIRSAKGFFYNTVVAQAQKIDVASDRITFTFLPAHRALREQFEQSREWLESVAERLAGHRVAVVAAQMPGQETAAAEAPAAAAPPAGKRDLKAEAMSSSAVQAMLDVFPAEIRDVEEM
jgi:DNA polymerase-3 subunit gamma/tau